MSKNLFASILFLGFVSSFFNADAQAIKVLPDAQFFTEGSVAVRSTLMKVELFKEVIPEVNARKWAVSVRPNFIREHAAEDLSELKEQKLQIKLKSKTTSPISPKAASAVTPLLGLNFEANWSVDGTPPDNHIAIANNSNIVSVNNDGIEYYSGNGSFLYADFWSDFFNDNTLTSMIYDPRVIYDSGSDRFVMVVLHGFTPTTSRVLLCFSKTNNPANGWWIYKLPGNPLNNNCWFDYPALGVSNNDIFITGNLFNANDQFNQAMIYQLPKAAGYNGGSISYLTWSNLSSTPYPAFSLVPASYGHAGNYGPGIYLVSSKSGGDNRIRLWNITDDAVNNPSLQSATVNTTAYSPAANAEQKGSTDLLDNGDCRIQSAFYLNGIIHYVFHSDIGEAWNGINYNRLNLSNLTNQSVSLGLQGTADYSYPSLVPFSTSATDKSVMIAFLRSSASLFPEVRVVNCDDNMEWSGSVLVKAGETFVDFSSDTEERWGDYTGMTRKHNSTTPRVWLSGSYGANITSQNANNTYITRIAEVYSSTTTPVTDISTSNKVSVYPNPSYDLINIRFSMMKAEKITINVIDQTGKLVKTLYQDIARAGENKLVFNRGALSKGVYFINISSESQIIKNEKIVILD
jgi:hypothetical protein